LFAQNGKILRVNLTNKQISTIKTEEYKQWGGGHGIGVAIFFDITKGKNIGAFDDDNVIAIVPGLFSGTLVPAGGRTELVGIQAQSYPYEWFSRSNIGGRLGNMLKFAGFDGVILEGKADGPTWISIIEGDVELKDASHLWGLDTYTTQKVIYKELSHGKGFDNWANTKSGRQTTQKPCVLTIGPAGENRSRIASILTDTGSGFGQGGFGGVWGAKNLKAISVVGTGSIDVADAKALLNARLWAENNYGANCDRPTAHFWQECMTSHFAGHPSRFWAPFDKYRRASGCHSCHLNCRPRTSTALGNDSTCMDSMFYQNWDIRKHGRISENSGKATDLAQQFGINTFELHTMLFYLNTLYNKGILGRGKKINTDLPMDKIGEVELVEDLLHKIAYRKDIGDDLAEGLPRAAERWGRLEEDQETGLLGDMFWGYPAHYDARAEVYWGYASIMSARDVNCHDFNVLSYWMPTVDIKEGRMPLVSAEQVARWIGEIGPYYDPEMVSFSTDNIYSVHMARTTAWLLHYSLFWKQSCGLCDNAFADFINPYRPDCRGLTPEGELKFYQSVTGEELSFDDSMEIGRKILNLDKAIWTLQGRHRETEKFPKYIYTLDAQSAAYLPGRPPIYYMPTMKDGKWEYQNVIPRHISEQEFEEWKTLFYELEGWDPKTGWQTRATLEAMGLKYVADQLNHSRKLP